MDVLSPVSDEEREDGEIVDDDLEDISDYTIPSDGKSDYSEGIIRPISLSSISGSDDGVHDYCERKLWLLNGTRARRRYAAIALRDKSKGRPKVARERKRRRDANQPRARKYKRRRSYSRSASLSSAPSSSGGSPARHVLDSQTLRQLNKAVRIDATTEELQQQHRTLKERLQRMIQQDGGLSASEEDDKQKDKALDETMDKELEELRLQALKSAMLKNHFERKRRKEAMNNLDLVGKAVNDDNDNEKDKENSSDNTESRTVVREVEAEITVEDDLDIMRAMLLASMSEKITTEQPALNPIQNNFNSLSLSSSSSPIPPEFSDKKRAASVFTVPPVKPLIIRVNYASESDTDFEFDYAEGAETQRAAVPEPEKIENSVEELLRRQRKQFEAKLEKQRKRNHDADESPLDKSFLKLLPKSQQQEYKLLRAKLLLAKKTKTKSKTSPNEDKDKDATPTDNVKMPRPPRERRESRSQPKGPKGKYRELAPLVRRIQAELASQRQQEEHEQRLIEQLRAARGQLAAHRQRHAELVAQFKRARAIIDLRWKKTAATGTGTETIKMPQTKPQTEVDAEVEAETEAQTVPVENNNDMPEANEKEVTCAIKPVEEDLQPAEVPVPAEPLQYVSPLDKREPSVGNNPLCVLCPYELFGVCKDASCTFNHCP